MEAARAWVTASKGLLLVLHVSLDRLDQIGDLVVTLLEQHVDIGPGAVVIVAQPHQIVVEDDSIDEHSHYEQQKCSPFDHVAPSRSLDSFAQDADIPVKQQSGAITQVTEGYGGLQVEQKKKGLSPRLSPCKESRLFTAYAESDRRRASFHPDSSRGGELGDSVAGSGSDFHIEYLGADQRRESYLYPWKGNARNPVPAFMVVASIDAHHDFHLGLAPEAGIIGAAQTGCQD